ncbi:MAG: cupin domain-containing protein [Myxococcota bacterium]
MTAEEVIRALELQAHPEGGHYAEVFRSDLRVNSDAHPGTRCASTAIYFLLKTGDFSALHRVRSDEAWHHYAGDPLELTLIDGDHADRLRLGKELTHGERPFAMVRRGVWQAAQPLAGPHGYSLCGCTVAPGFEFEDFALPSRAALLAELPQHRELVIALTRG